MQTPGSSIRRYLFSLDNCMGFNNQALTINLSKYIIPPGGVVKKHRKCLKKWKHAKQLGVHKKKNCLTLASFATADRYNLEAVLSTIKTQDRYTACELTNDMPMKTELCNALHLRSRHLNGTEDSHVFCFDVGTVVMWNLTYGQGKEMLEFLGRFEQCPYSFNLKQLSSELLNYKYTECKSSYLHDNTLYFGVAKKNSDMIGLNRFLISSVISLSAKVSAFEGMVERNLKSMESTASRIKAGKGLKIKQKQVMAIAGTTYSMRHNLKQSTYSLLLPCELLEHFESSDERESFANAVTYFGLTQRMEMFDNNLTFCQYYTHLILDHYSNYVNLRLHKIFFVLICLGGLGLVVSYVFTE